jgi:hypothetical protein
MVVIPALRRVRQENCEFEPSLVYNSEGLISKTEEKKERKKGGKKRASHYYIYTEFMGITEFMISSVFLCIFFYCTCFSPCEDVRCTLWLLFDDPNGHHPSSAAVWPPLNKTM